MLNCAGGSSHFLLILHEPGPGMQKLQKCTCYEEKQDDELAEKEIKYPQKPSWIKTLGNGKRENKKCTTGDKSGFNLTRHSEYYIYL